MDSVFSAIFSWQLLLFCLGVAAVTFIIIKLVEYFILDNPKLPGNKASKLWRSLLLPIGPVVGGALLGLVAVQYPFPEGINSVSGRVIFGLVAGLLSGLVYRVINGMLKKTGGIESEDDSEDCNHKKHDCCEPHSHSHGSDDSK